MQFLGHWKWSQLNPRPRSFVREGIISEQEILEQTLSYLYSCPNEVKFLRYEKKPNEPKLFVEVSSLWEVPNTCVFSHGFKKQKLNITLAYGSGHNFELLQPYSTLFSEGVWSLEHQRPKVFVYHSKVLRRCIISVYWTKLGCFGTLSFYHNLLE